MAFGIPSASEVINKSRETIARFPLAWLASIVVALISVYLVEIEPRKMEGLTFILSKVILSGTLAFFVFVAVRLWGEARSKQWHWIGTAIAVGGVLLYYMILPEHRIDFRAHMIPFRHFFLSLLFLVAFFWVPFTGSRIDNRDYWTYAKQILFALVMTGLFTIVVILGLNGALFAVDKLFDIAIKGKRYFQMDILIMGIFSIGYFLSQIPSSPTASKFTNTPPKVERFFTKWLLTTLSGLYFVILYAYTAKVLWTMNWPKGILAWLIVIFSTVMILTYLFWTHFTRAQGRGWRRWVWLGILLQTVMLFVAIGMRIAEYSWTESRYMVFVLGVWLAGVSLYFLLFRQARLRWIFVSLSLLIAVTQFGPLNAYRVSEQAQMQRLRDNVAQLKTHAVAEEAPMALRYEISDGIQYLDRRYRGDALEQIFPKITKAFEILDAKRKKQREARKKQQEKGIAIAVPIEEDGKPYALPAYITEELGFVFIDRWEYKRIQEGEQRAIEFSVLSHNRDRRHTMMDVKGYDHVTNIGHYGYDMVDHKKKRLKEVGRSFASPKLTYRYTPEFKLTFSIEDKESIFDLKEIFQKFIIQYPNGSKKMNKEEMIFYQTLGKMRFKLVLDSIGKQTVQDHLEVIHFSGTLLIKEEDQP